MWDSNLPFFNSPRMHVYFWMRNYRPRFREELLWSPRHSVFLGLGRGQCLPRMFLPHLHARLPSFPRECRGPEHLVRWYKRGEAQKRFTFFFCSTSLAGAFGGLLAYAISKLDGKAGLASWRWVFVVGVSVPPRWWSYIDLAWYIQRV